VSKDKSKTSQDSSPLQQICLIHFRYIYAVCVEKNSGKGNVHLELSCVSFDYHQWRCSPVNCTHTHTHTRTHTQVIRQKRMAGSLDEWAQLRPWSLFNRSQSIWHYKNRGWLVVVLERKRTYFWMSSGGNRLLQEYFSFWRFEYL